MTAIADRRSNAIPSRNRPPNPTAPFQPTLEKGEAGGYASLDETSARVPDVQLASGTAAAGKALMGDRTWGDVATQVELDAEVTARAAADTAEAASRVAGDAAERADAATKYLKITSNLLDIANDASARTNLGLGTAATRDVPAAGDAGVTEVVKGTDSRLTDTRTPTNNTVSTAKLVDDSVTYAKIQNVSATDKLLGRSTAGAGDVEEIACTAAARALLDDAAASDQRTTLGLGSGDIATFLALILGPLAVAQYTARTNGGFALADNASTAWPASESGLGFLYDTNNSGACLFAWYDGGNVAIIWQNAALFSTVATTAGKTNVYLSGGALTVENKRGAAAALRGFVWKVA